MAYPLLGVTAGFALLALLVPSSRLRPLLLPVASGVHLVLSAVAIAGGAHGLPEGAWLALDLPGRVVLGVVSIVFLGCSWYAVGYLRLRKERDNRVFCASLLGLLAALTLVVYARHLGLLWVAVEAAALVAAPLIHFSGTPQSIEATWKYLLVGGVGLALALLGSFFLGYAALHAGEVPSLRIDDLLQSADRLSTPWVRAALVFLLVGYGTKMGLAPMHTWKPDAYGESPGVVGAVLAAGVTSGAFLAVVRVTEIAHAAGEGALAGRLLITLGLLSMAVAGVFMVGQRDLKRLLAWSSVEHMGILAIGIGLGGAAVFGALLHLIVNALTKSVLFLSAGNIQGAFGSKSVGEVRGAFGRTPISATLFFAGFLAITGSPPFGPFLSELTIVSAAFEGGRWVLGASFLLLLLVVFVGMGQTVLAITLGEPSAPGEGANASRDGVATALPIAAFLALVLLLGLWIPAPLGDLLRGAAVGLGGP